MSTDKRTHVFINGPTTMTVVVEPDRDYVAFRITLSGIPLKPEQVPLFKAWMEPIVMEFDKDPRPNLMINCNTGETLLAGEKWFLLQKPI